MMAKHEFFCEVFASLQNSSCLSGADNHQAGQTFVVFEIIPYTGNQRIFRSDNNHIDIFFGNEAGDGFKICRFYGNIFCNFTCSCISRGYI